MVPKSQILVSRIQGVGFFFFKARELVEKEVLRSGTGDMEAEGEVGGDVVTPVERRRGRPRKARHVEQDSSPPERHGMANELAALGLAHGAIVDSHPLTSNGAAADVDTSRTKRLRRGRVAFTPTETPRHRPKQPVGVSPLPTFGLFCVVAGAGFWPDFARFVWLLRGI